MKAGLSANQQAGMQVKRFVCILVCQQARKSIDSELIDRSTMDTRINIDHEHTVHTYVPGLQQTRGESLPVAERMDRHHRKSHKPRRNEACGIRTQTHVGLQRV